MRLKSLAKAMILTMALGVCVGCLGQTSTYAAAKKTVKYSLSKKGTLTVSGKGKMKKKYDHNKKIKKVIIKKGITSIPSHAFEGCKKLKSVKISKTVKKIGEYSFAGIKAKKIIVPKTVKTINTRAFINNKLDYLEIPGNVKVKGTTYNGFSCVYIGEAKTVQFNSPLSYKVCDIFRSKNIKVSKKDKMFVSIDGAVYTKDKKILVRVPALRTAFTVADGCETVYFSAFMNTAYVDDDFTFYLCDKLTNLTLPNSVKVFEDNKKFASDYSASKDFQKITIKWDGASEEQIKNIMEKIERK